jgi:hypothetical protein
VVPVIGPSKAGMTPAIQQLWLNDLVPAIDCKDMDRILGSRRRNGAAAAELLQAFVSDPRYGRLLVDVGSAQLIRPELPAALRSLTRYPHSVAVLWCDEATFRRRNSPGIKPELYYGNSPLVQMWEAARGARRLVDTSGDESPQAWARKLADNCERNPGRMRTPQNNKMQQTMDARR